MANSNSTDYLRVNGKYSSLSIQGKKLKNDCTVRSIATAFDVSMRSAFKLAEDKFMREPGKGVSGAIIQDAFESGKFNKVDGRKFSVRTMKKDEITNRYKLKGEIVLRKKTVKSFIASHPKGTYYVLVSNHTFTVKDGELLDHGNFGNQPTRKVQGAFQVVGEKVDNGQLEFNF